MSCLCGEAARAGHAYQLVRKRDRKIPVASAKPLIHSPPSLMHVIAESRRSRGRSTLFLFSHFSSSFHQPPIAHSSVNPVLEYGCF